MPKKSSNAYFYEGFVRQYIDSQPSNPRHKYIDKPAMHKAVPDLNGKSVLAIGCGSGDELNYLRYKGARKVVGIDSSEYMVKASRINAPEAEVYKMSADKLAFKKESFDFVYSDLAVHYVSDIGKVFLNVYRVLNKNGLFLFSTTHPIEDTLEKIKLSGQKELKVLGYSKINGIIDRVYGDYFNKKRITEKWFGGDEVTFYYTLISDIINKAILSGFRIVEVLEPKPLKSMQKASPDLYKRMARIPFILIFKLKKE